MGEGWGYRARHYTAEGLETVAATERVGVPTGFNLQGEAPARPTDIVEHLLVCITPTQTSFRARCPSSSPRRTGTLGPCNGCCRRSWRSRRSPSACRAPTLRDSGVPTPGRAARALTTSFASHTTAARRACRRGRTSFVMASTPTSRVIPCSGRTTTRMVARRRRPTECRQRAGFRCATRRRGRSWTRRRRQRPSPSTRVISSSAGPTTCCSRTRTAWPTRRPAMAQPASAWSSSRARTPTPSSSACRHAPTASGRHGTPR
mmetsp:Transcript_34111/g.107444  ORF Transcript_34111/g.107444 Transcript_34111/m.107444 type:complete len:261 (-) Transcript_34111:45-827(-)